MFVVMSRRIYAEFAIALQLDDKSTANSIAIEYVVLRAILLKISNEMIVKRRQRMNFDIFPTASFDVIRLSSL